MEVTVLTALILFGGGIALLVWWLAPTPYCTSLEEGKHITIEWRTGPFIVKQATYKPSVWHTREDENYQYWVKRFKGVTK